MVLFFMNNETIKKEEPEAPVEKVEAPAEEVVAEAPAEEIETPAEEVVAEAPVEESEESEKDSK